MEGFLLVFVIFTVLPCILTFLITKRKTLKKAGVISTKESEFSSLDVKIKEKKEELSGISKSLAAKEKELSSTCSEYEKLIIENKDLVLLKGREKELLNKTDEINRSIENLASIKERLELRISELIEKDDLYSRIDELVGYGHYDTPEYLYETSDRYNIEIKNVRNEQKEMIRNGTAITYPEDNIITNFTQLQKQIFNNTTKLMLRTYNIECDMLISKVNPGNFVRMLERISKLSTDIEKLALTLEIGFNEDYVDLKMTECELFYHYKLKKQEELEKQRLLKEQMREEQKAAMEYQKAIDDAKKEEDVYSRLLERAKQELELSTDKEAAQMRIDELERQLTEAIERSKRAQSMAELTRKGYIYVISNIGSFGEDVYKIGMTRRLEPMDRIRELGDASVPFCFDVHAIISSDDAPALEAAIHRHFAHRRINAVNFRKEFFKVTIDEIKTALDELIGAEGYELTTTVLAEEYFESRRLER